MIERERWAKLDELLDAALERPAAERRPFLESASGGDDALHRDVLRLLELAEAEDSELRPGALAGESWDAADPLEDAAAPELPRGTPVGPYRVVGLLGRGGMGYVYEAEDPKLGRHVALKVLPTELDSEDRRRRFEREARILAALNHPGIVNVYSIEESAGVRYIAMERVCGRTLAQSIAPGGMALGPLLEIAIPLADALAAAHARGVVHRDLKPANVMVTDDGRVKVLDFGVAKWPGRGLESSALTQQGVVVGTASYMSPEQAEGRATDPRSDVFTLGVLLFQMASGELPFRGSSAASGIEPRLPAELSRIVKRCLAEEPERRYPSALELRSALEELRRGLASGELMAARRRRRVALAAAAAALLAVLALLRPGARRAPPLAGAFARATSMPGPEYFPSLSPDGRLLAYAGRERGRWDVYLLRLGGQGAVNLTGEWPGDDLQPAFSPDGRSLAFRSSRAGGGVFVMSATGGPARRIVDRGWNPSWSADGSEIAFATYPVFDSPYDRPAPSELWAVNVTDGRTRRVTADDAVQPAWSPHGRRIAFWGLVKGGSRRDLWTVAADGGPAVPVTADDAVDWSPAWAPDGTQLYFSSDRGGSMNLWRVAIDEQSGRVSGVPEPVTTPAAFAHHASFARETGRLAYVSSSFDQALQRAPFDLRAERVTGEPQPIARDLGRLGFSHVSADGQWLVYSQSEPQEDLVLSRLDGSERRALTRDAYRDRRPQFSPDGSRIAFYSDRGGHYEIWTVARDGSELRQLTRDPERRNARYPVWSPDGAQLLFSRPGITGWIVAVSGGEHAPPLRELPPFLDPGFSFTGLDWSPDGRLIAGMLRSDAGERGGIAVYDLGRARYTSLVPFGTFPHWLPDSRRLVFQAPTGSERALERDYPRGESLYVVDRVSRRVRELLTIPEVALGYPVVSADGRWLVFARTTVKADIWTLTIEPRS